MKRNYTTLGIGALLILIFLAILSCVQVRQSTVVVITTFGKPSRTLDKPGLYLKWPIPIQWAHTFDQRIQNFDDKLDEAYTADSFTLLTMVYAGWKINDAQAFFPKFENGSIAEAERALTGIIRSTKTAVVGKHPLSDFVSTDEKQIKFDQIEHEILTMVQDQVNQKNYGIKMEFLGIKKLGFPEAVTQEVFKRMTSERELFSNRILAEANTEASNIRTSANAKSTEITANADAQATRIKGEALAEAAKSFAVFQQNPGLANFLLDLNAMELSMRDRTTLIFDQHSQPFNLFQGYSTNLFTSPK
ncbi:MAG TPA: protease modulator HflC [Verrucomicrobiae bacterium]|nr:protease modulator HflC [Verrucomicrobiae bacterium]